ncbi:hypothetical protein ColLi_01439 [Colletotrichum liriopes]|uniref:Uncharacterized protein n=1 Tax=Colletotrichum liriopes TaxID=708192 RepID=A0AA37GCX3_9PEZI|nr:hypothetical protein ColLi_01439 [Colletotrichum liriopes]
MAYGEEMNDISLGNAFSAARSEGFKFMCSFDYAGRGPWPKALVISMLKYYGSTAENFKHSDGKPLVSTFEGSDNAKDWIEIKGAVSSFVIPNWSSNDYGKSYHIGPLHDYALTAFKKENGNSLFNYAEGLPHDGWRLTLPYWINYYKNGKSTVTKEGLVTWY